MEVVVVWEEKKWRMTDWRTIGDWVTFTDKKGNNNEKRAGEQKGGGRQDKTGIERERERVTEKHK